MRAVWSELREEQQPQGKYGRLPKSDLAHLGYCNNEYDGGIANLNE